MGRVARFKSVKEMVKTALVVLVLFAGSISAKSECSNRCENGGWCGERRKNTTTGAVQRCADRTRYGKSCASTCGKGDNDYHWCWVGWHLEDDWVLRTSGSNQIWGGLCWRLRSEGEELLVVLHGQRRKRVGILLPTRRGFGHSLHCERPGLCWRMWNSRGEILVVPKIPKSDNSHWQICCKGSRLGLLFTKLAEHEIQQAVL